MEKEDKRPHPPRFAPGMTDEQLEENATPEEIARGNSTSVTRLEQDRYVDE
ncbi:hypothetical protein [Polycladomyces subterraneus]|uniref:Uncharacterized protein n=1 Tax=Polycladomyces subterraneus TaxID=1016997 RepID=A0ABT8IN46_9BACL|nr:hypothetical protein [Polycladomyces subterraneus]MDN4593956.1 hypothetical protein [Polycladomyces subterraneus]